MSCCSIDPKESARGFVYIEAVLVIGVMAVALIESLSLVETASKRLELIGLAHRAMVIPGEGGPQRVRVRLERLFRAQGGGDENPACVLSGRTITCSRRGSRTRLVRQEGLFRQTVTVSAKLADGTTLQEQVRRYEIWP